MEKAKFHQRFFEARDNRLITKAALAKLLCTSRQQILKYETGVSVPNIDVLLKIADFLEVSADYLLGRDDYLTLQKGAKQRFIPVPDKLTEEEFELAQDFVNLLIKKNSKKRKSVPVQAPLI